nr:undecaprenyl-diphosphate phosphatase [Rhizobium tibeticum]
MLATCSLPKLQRARIGRILIAFLAAAIVGVLAHEFIKSVLFETPLLVCIVLILGGIVLLVVDRIDFQRAKGPR